MTEVGSQSAAGAFSTAAQLVFPRRFEPACHGRCSYADEFTQTLDEVFVLVVYFRHIDKCWRYRSTIRKYLQGFAPLWACLQGSVRTIRRDDSDVSGAFPPITDSLGPLENHFDVTAKV